MSDYKFIPDENFDVDDEGKVFDKVSLQGATFSLTEKGEIIVLLPTEGGCCAESYSLTKMLNWVCINKPEWVRCYY